MHQSYTIRQDHDQSWSVVASGTGMPVRLAGIIQTGLKLIEAEILLDLLAQGVAYTPDSAAVWASYPESATVA